MRRICFFKDEKSFFKKIELKCFENWYFVFKITALILFTKTLLLIERLLKKFKIGMVAFWAMALMMVAGWQFDVGGTEEVF